MATERHSTRALAALGWDPGWASAFLPHESAGLVAGRVAAAHRDAWVVSLGTTEREAVIAGRLRFEAAGPGDMPAVGDWVAIEPVGAEGPAVITAVLPRRSALRRSNGDGRAGAGRVAAEQVLAANVDVALLVSGLDGDFNLRRLERYLTVAYAGGAAPVVVLNKVDIDDDVDAHRVAAEAVAPGVPVHAVSARTGHGLDRLADAHLRPGTTAVVLGSSGVGKSTLVNALVGAARQRTNDVRADDSKGRHTTTVRELIPIGDGVLLVDTPGLRSLEVAGADDGIEAAFADVADLAMGCRFRDCGHDGEPGCAVRAALDTGTLDARRFDSYRKLEREAARAVRQADPFARAEERRRWKAIHKSVGEHMRHKYGEG